MLTTVASSDKKLLLQKQRLAKILLQILENLLAEQDKTCNPRNERVIDFLKLLQVNNCKWENEWRMTCSYNERSPHRLKQLKAAVTSRSFIKITLRQKIFLFTVILSMLLIYGPLTFLPHFVCGTWTSKKFPQYYFLIWIDPHIHH